LYHIKHLEKIQTLNITRKFKKSKVRKADNRRKLGVHYIEELKQLSKQLLAAKKSAKEAFLKSILSKEGKCWAEFYR
jgi:CRISPR/Cas system-associated endonuclease Cas1